MSTFNSKADRAAYIFFFLLGPSAKFHPLKLTNGLIGVYNVPHRFMCLITWPPVGGTVWREVEKKNLVKQLPGWNKSQPRSLFAGGRGDCWTWGLAGRHQATQERPEACRLACSLPKLCLLVPEYIKTQLHNPATATQAFHGWW